MPDLFQVTNEKIQVCMMKLHIITKTLLLHVEYLPRVKQKTVYVNFLLII